jgi:hypothetical protein
VRVGCLPPEDLLLDPALHVLPRLQLDGPSFDRGHAARDLDLPRRFGVWVEDNLLATLAAKRDLALAALDIESDVDAVDMVSGIEELKQRLSSCSAPGRSRAR